MHPADLSDGIPVNEILAQPEAVISPSVTPAIWRTLQRVSKFSEALKERSDVEQCIRIGSQKIRDELIQTSNVIKNLPAKQKVEFHPILDGENLQRYEIIWEGNYLKYDTKKLYNPKTPEIFECPKLLIKRVAEKLSIALDTGDGEDCFYALNTVYLLHQTSQSNQTIEYILGIINSTFLDWLYRVQYEAISIRGGYVEFRENLKYLPIRRINFTTPAAQRKTRAAALVKLYERNADAELLADIERCLPKNADGTFLAFAPNATGAEEQSDVVHDLLAHLAEQMIALNKEKQAEQRRFLNWLGGIISKDEGRRMKDEFVHPSSLILHPSLSALTGKTIIQNYWGDYQKGQDAAPFDAIVDVLHKNRTRIGVSVNDARFVAKLKAEYEKSLATLLPIKAQLKRTDALIDQVVYRLYGLTEEEVKVVKGKR